MSNASEKPITAYAEPADMVAAFEHAFNTRNLDQLEELFEPDALLILAPGEVLAGDGRRARNSDKLPGFLPIKVSVRHQYITGDIALLINDYVHEGTTSAGKHLRIEGTAVDVLRRGDDGAWRCVISNPAGIKTAGELPH
ncbi:nuclear transport factor 2 family protein [Micromonospora arborensis]|uniref:YybH family protein n=1 Tax=Micromonospora arborensis TaxID=2116518 RepID=UPI0034060883